jgi:uncharacterized protein (TIGR00255 family)
MACSMTGYGRAEAENKGYKFTVEITSVNNRFLEYQIRLPKSLSALENDIKSLLSTKFNRGKVTVTVNWEQEAADGNIVLDEARADAFFEIYRQLAARFDLKGTLELKDFAALPDLFKMKQVEEDEEHIWPILQRAVLSAAEAAHNMRSAEGANLTKDLLERGKSIRKVICDIESLSEQNVKAYQNRLKSRIEELLGGADIDEERIAVEVALVADKSDITEECVRLKSHLEQFEASLKDAGPVGKRLNFILQELNRETNTIGDKSAFYEISRRVIDIKEQIERLREQVQNIE